jgi:monoamine oxidase
MFLNSRKRYHRHPLPRAMMDIQSVLSERLSRVNFWLHFVPSSAPLQNIVLMLSRRSLLLLPSFKRLSSSVIRTMSSSIPSGEIEETFHDVCVVGGGMGGLYTAHQLLNKHGVKDIVVLESRQWLGGRLITTMDEDDKTPKFNDFAWRIGETNIMMKQIAEDFGVELVPQMTPPEENDETSHKVKNVWNTSPRGQGKPPLSTFSAAALESTALADEQDRESGYAGRTAQISFPGETHGVNNWYAPKGMNEFPQAVARTLPDGMVKTYHRASDVIRQEDGTYKVEVLHTHGYEYTKKIIRCKYVVLAIPPFAARALTVAKDMQPALFAVYERRLGHIYVQCKPGTSNVPDTSTGVDRIYRMLPDSILQQIVSGDYGHNVFQAGYACDRFERVWRELQFQGPEAVQAEVKKQLAKVSGIIDPTLADSIEKAFVRILFVHRWQVEAHVSGKTKEELSLQAITPNPAILPGLYLVGEAYSAQQGWTEGAVWTAAKVAELIGKQNKESEGDGNIVTASEYAQPCDLDENTIQYRGLVMDASKWPDLHPGGPRPIHWMKGHDMTTMFESYHRGWPVSHSASCGIKCRWCILNNSLRLSFFSLSTHPRIRLRPFSDFKRAM